ncbi:MAG: NADH-quinone oxidoreductase subunit NuoN [Herbaspirillum sp.]
MNDMNLIPVYPEIFLLIATSAILLIDMFLPDAKRSITYLLSLLTLVLCAALTFTGCAGDETVYTFNDMFVSDPLSCLLKLFSYLAVGLTLVYARRYNSDRAIVGGAWLGGEFYALALFSLLGQMIMISGNSFLSIYLGLELMSLPLYALVALRRDDTGATEAAMKYFVLGALASGFLLYGISMLYGATGSLELSGVHRAIVSSTVDSSVLVFGLVFVVAGLAFKLGAVPFHMWVPDVYHGAPTPMTLLIGGAPKLAAFAILFRLLVEGLLPLAIDWQQMLMVLAALSIIIGNVTAIAQTNIKRMLAYSAISHMGFMLLGMISGIVDGNLFQAINAYSSSLFYAITYVLITLGAFGVILLMTRSGFEADTLDDFKGLNQRSPWFAAVMLVLMFSLAGIPPMVGFYAKLSVLQALLGAGQIWLVVLAVVFSLIGAFYYLRVIKNMYFDDPVDNGRVSAGFDMRIALSLNGLTALALGLWPGPLMDVCTNAIVITLATFLSKVVAG